MKKVLFSPQSASVLQWPIGYRAGLAIANDAEYLTLDGLSALREFFKEEFKSDKIFSTSAFLLNPNVQNPGFSIFNNAKDFEISRLMRSLLDSGIIDGVHALVDADLGPVPNSEISPLVKKLGNKFKLRWWSNHGSSSNLQNIGHHNLRDYQEGDVETSNYYSLDFARSMGIRYFTLDDDNRLELSLKHNQMLRTRECRDGSSITSFQRYRGLPGLPAPTLESFSDQVNSKLLKKLIHRRGGLVVYQHMGITARQGRVVDRVLNTASDIPGSAVATFREIYSLQSDGLWFARASAFLEFINARSSIFAHAKGNQLVIGGRGDGNALNLSNVAVSTRTQIHEVTYLPSLTLACEPSWEFRKTNQGGAVVFGESS